MNPFQRAWKAALAARPERAALTHSAALDLAASELRRAPTSYARVALVLIDGRSGSGKTQFADDLLRRCPTTQGLHLDDLYPGWEGLEAGVERARDLVTAWSAGSPATYTPTTWPGTPPRAAVTLDADRSLVVEGVGARHCLPHPAREIAVLRLYLDLDDELRRKRALERDGEVYAPHWPHWAAQEDADLARYPVAADRSDIYVVTEPPTTGGSRA